MQDAGSSLVFPPSKTLAPDSTGAWGLGPEGVQIVLE
jgi:hypothetical protein